MNGRKNRTHGSTRCENLTRLAVSAALITLTACGGGGSGDSGSSNSEQLDLSNLQSVPPAFGSANAATVNAAADVVEAAAGTPVTASILSNDTIPTGTQMQLLGQAEHGTATLLDNGELHYVADADFEGTDTIEYVLVAADGSESHGILYVAVACADCLVEQATPVLATANESGLRYCTDANPDPDGDGYGWENDASCAIPALGAATPLFAAKTDSVSLSAGETTAVSPLRNDLIADRSSVDFTIDVAPGAGEIKASEAGIIVYSAPRDFNGSDSIVYSISDAEGNSSMANINFSITLSLIHI